MPNWAGASERECSIAARHAAPSAVAHSLDHGSVVRPGGLIMVTVSGEAYASRLPRWEDLREPFAKGGLIVRKPERAGSNACAAFHPEPYLRGTLTAGLEIVEHTRGVREVGWQDAVLLRTPER